MKLYSRGLLLYFNPAVGCSYYFHSEKVPRIVLLHSLFVGKGKCLRQPDKVPVSRTCSYAVCVCQTAAQLRRAVRWTIQSDWKDSCQRCCLERRLICRYPLGKSPTDFNQSSFFYAQSVWCHKCKFQLCILCCSFTFMLCPLFGCQNKGAAQPVDDWSVSTGKLWFIWQIRQLFHYHQSSIIFMNLPFVRTRGEHGCEPTNEICSWQKIMLNVTFLFSLVYIKEGSKTRTDFRVVQLEVFRFRPFIFSSVCIISSGCRHAIALPSPYFDFKTSNMWYHVVMLWYKLFWRTL